MGGVGQRAETGDCIADRSRLAQVGMTWSAQSGMPASSHAVWRVRYNSARLMAASGDMANAAKLAEQAFDQPVTTSGSACWRFRPARPSATLASVATSLPSSRER